MTDPYEAAHAAYRAKKQREADDLLRSEFNGGLDAPTRPRVTHAEQRELSLDRTLTQSYERWRGTVDGMAVYAEVLARVMRAAAAGSTRIGVKLIVELVRHDLKTSVNNSFSALMAREVLDEHPELAPLVELRERKAA